MSFIKSPAGRRAVALLAVASAAGLALTGCGSGGEVNVKPSGIITDPSTHPATTVTFWSFVTLPNEIKSVQDAVNRLTDAYPWLTVNVVNNKTDDDFTKAVTAGDAPDIHVSWAPDSVAQFCTNGSVIDMSNFVQESGLDVAGTFPASSLDYTQYQGKQCALPLLVDAYGLYYNKDLFAKAGITDTPKTLTQLLDDAKKLTIKNPDGTIKQWGLTPPSYNYDVGTAWFVGGATGAQFYDANGNSTFGTDPTWAELLNWQKSMLDFYGATNVNKFVATYKDHTDDEKNPFAAGVSAMEMNGEWHIGELADEVPNLNYGIVPVPVPDSKAPLYGGGNVAGNVIYVSSQSQHQAEAYFVAQQLATDTTFVDDFATQMGNVPTTFDALKAWTLPQTQPVWQTMLDIVSSPNSYYKTLTPAGEEDSTKWGDFVTSWEQGDVKDLQAGLTQLDQTIADINQQASQ